MADSPEPQSTQELDTLLFEEAFRRLNEMAESLDDGGLRGKGLVGLVVLVGLQVHLDTPPPLHQLVRAQANVVGDLLVLAGRLPPAHFRDFGKDEGSGEDGAGLAAGDVHGQRVHHLAADDTMKAEAVGALVAGGLFVTRPVKPELGLCGVPGDAVVELDALPQAETPAVGGDLLPALYVRQGHHFKGFGVDPAKANLLAQEIKSVADLGLEIGVVIGAGNIIRGEMAAEGGMERVPADYLGMLATIINAITLQDALEKVGCETRTLSAITISQLAEPYIRRRALRHLEKGRTAIIAGGTGNPYFSTDTAAALRATELGADIVLKGTKVDGVYDKDPVKHDDAKKYDILSFQKVIEDGLRVMDLTAVTLCKENNLPIIVFDIKSKNGLVDIVNSVPIGTTVS